MKQRCQRRSSAGETWRRWGRCGLALRRSLASRRQYLVERCDSDRWL